MEMRKSHDAASSRRKQQTAKTGQLIRETLVRNHAIGKKTLFGLPTDFIRVHRLALGYAHDRPGRRRIGE